MKRVILLITAAALVAALPLAAQPPAAGGGPGAGEAFGAAPRLHRALAAFLELTEEQIEAARALRTEARAEAEPLITQLRRQGEALRALLDSANPDPAAVGQAILTLHELKGELRALRESYEADFEALLTPEQLDRFEAFKAAMRALRHGRAGRRGPGPAGGPPEPGDAP